jgi:hypothetical protein
LWPPRPAAQAPARAEAPEEEALDATPVTGVPAAPPAVPEPAGAAVTPPVSSSVFLKRFGIDAPSGREFGPMGVLDATYQDYRPPAPVPASPPIPGAVPEGTWRAEPISQGETAPAAPIVDERRTEPPTPVASPLTPPWRVEAAPETPVTPAPPRRPAHHAAAPEGIEPPPWPGVQSVPNVPNVQNTQNVHHAGPPLPAPAPAARPIGAPPAPHPSRGHAAAVPPPTAPPVRRAPLRDESPAETTAIMSAEEILAAAAAGSASGLTRRQIREAQLSVTQRLAADVAAHGDIEEGGER